MTRITLAAAILLGASAASANFTPAYTYNSITVVNDSATMLSEVMVEDTRHGSKHQCGSIKPMDSCTIWVGSKRYQDNPLRVSWAQGGTASKTEELVLDVPLTLSTGPVLRGVITVDANGMLSATADQPYRR